MQSKRKEEESQKPTWSKRVYSAGGYIECAVFEREVKGGNGNFTAYSTTIKRSYKDGDEWKSTTSFRTEDLPIIGLLLAEAFKAITDDQQK